jgi:catechol 2,3-dioxygenase-like lactoylglutathione lyase family enzyme
MISGAHMILYSTDAEADRAFFRDILQFPAVDAGGGWLIFALPRPKSPSIRRLKPMATKSI